MNLWQKAGRLTGPTPLMVSRRGRVRPPTREEAAAMLEAAIAALEAAGVPVRVMNNADCAVVLIKGGKWRNENEKDKGFCSNDGAGAFVDGVRFKPIRAGSEGATPDPHPVALPHGQG